jgi:integrase
LKLREHLNETYRLITDAMLNTGLRAVEFWALVEHPEWYYPSSRVIDLPKEGAANKVKSTKKDRTIRLTSGGCKSLDTLFALKVEFRDRDAMRKALRRAGVAAGFGTKGIMPKMFRKMLASWLVECRKELYIDSLDITANMGHEERTLRDNYLGIGFDKRDHDDMLEFLKGWKAE